MDAAKKSTVMDNKGAGVETEAGRNPDLKSTKRETQLSYLAFLTFALYFVFCIRQCLCEECGHSCERCRMFFTLF